MVTFVYLVGASAKLDNKRCRAVMSEEDIEASEVDVARKLSGNNALQTIREESVSSFDSLNSFKCIEKFVQENFKRDIEKRQFERHLENNLEKFILKKSFQRINSF